jgi:hypothetical protein
VGPEVAVMHLQRERVSDSVSRYLVTAHLGPRSCLMLVDPSDGAVAASWRTDERTEIVRGEWISTCAELVGLVDGLDLDDQISA